jgi:hypothetical protein
MACGVWQFEEWLMAWLVVNLMLASMQCSAATGGVQSGTQHSGLTPLFCCCIRCLAGGIWQQNASQIKQQLRQRLADSKARWKLVVGHHPIASYGHHCKFSMDGDCDHMAWLEAELQVRMLPLKFVGVFS